ncbi:hypothetical protein [Solwaraspora sp. WMMD792]|uniref:hypothetical protein n=1 Tax=Solwaraspora sp. WMMD792 TaxID=3016099 RepID=UPI0024162AAE|nr:hypothetical protein [Solwaraspora sp. WMMD792]MDG4769005.1 hypothetical protein [Solwaraspora sp. WMMD792]
MADLPPLASVTQLATKIGYPDAAYPTQAEEDRALALLQEASELIRDAAEKDWVNDAGTALVDVPRRVEKICLAVAYRAFDNPKALVQKTIADLNQSYDRARVHGGDAVYLTDAEKKSVRRAAAASSFRSVTLVSPYSGDDTTESLLGS